MKKALILSILLIGLWTSAQAQGKFFTRDGYISFFSHTDVEDIDAHNRKVASVLDAQSGQLEFAVLMRAFEFKKALMQEHFNENYVESTKHPKAQFKGKILNLASVDFGTDGTYPVAIEGELTIKGVTKPLRTQGTIIVKGGIPHGKAEFTVLPSDYNIQIPALVRKNIAEEIQVKVDMAYQPLTN
ncbi:YceI family protein [Cesiribacter andamanensis]|uniref:Lipid/polyisoprenoid-binding YceI-like domain-containing protein n=1 Tax=Cesiribacter andamanensis AMV16 TaxID=1279009 RepID=M7NW19_9BACT|nr:YceI family protein [Cesiribacter andamanensis]EMR02659.1 hypothetical protein ADICEAN_02198 [Cesiribacter andamanensis AMV16]